MKFLLVGLEIQLCSLNFILFLQEWKSNIFLKSNLTKKGEQIFYPGDFFRSWKSKLFKMLIMGFAGSPIRSYPQQNLEMQNIENLSISKISKFNVHNLISRTYVTFHGENGSELGNIKSVAMIKHVVQRQIQNMNRTTQQISNNRTAGIFSPEITTWIFPWILTSSMEIIENQSRTASEE